MTIRSRNYNFIIYEDKFNGILDKINAINCTFLYILHDKDLDNDNNLKKPHYHFVITFDNARLITAVSDLLDLPVNFLEPCSSLKKSVLYLIHFNNPDKWLYDPSEVKGDIALFNQYYNNSTSETNDIKMILNFIDDFDCILRQYDISNFVLSKGLWSTYRRNYIIINNYLKEHNLNYSF